MLLFPPGFRPVPPDSPAPSAELVKNRSAAIPSASNFPSFCQAATALRRDQHTPGLIDLRFFQQAFPEQVAHLVEVDSFQGAKRSHDIFIDLLNGSEEFPFERYYSRVERLDIALVIGNIPLATGKIVGMSRGPQSEVALSCQ